VQGADSQDEVVTTQPEPQDETLINQFRDREGTSTRVIRRDGRLLTVLNITWGYDMTWPTNLRM
jgi:hypothetical protein